VLPAVSTRPRIFISYARKDARPRAECLAAALEESGFDVWMDRQRILGGASWSRTIEQAIDSSGAMLALLSPASYESRVCRGEHLTALDAGKPVVPVLVSAAAPRPVYLAADHYLVIDSDAAQDAAWTALLAALGSQGTATLSDAYRHRAVVQRPLPAAYLARESDLAALGAAVIADRDGEAPAWTALRGMGGSGKTVLATALLRDPAIGRSFPDGCAWIEVGRHPQPAQLLAQAREAGRSFGLDWSGVSTLLEASNRLRALLRERALLLVLDDVWSAADAQPFVAESARSSVLITTRDEAVARGLGAQVLALPTLPHGAALQLLARWSRTSAAALPAEAAAIVGECGGLPMALAMVGASLAGKPPSAWARRLERLRAADPARAGIALGDYAYPDVFKAIAAGIDERPAPEPERYRALAVFGDDAHVPAPILADLWGCDRLDAEDQIDVWRDASMASADADARLVLHDLQADYVRASSSDAQRQGWHGTLLERWRAARPGGWHVGDDDDASARYVRTHLLEHLVGAGRREEAEGLLLDGRWLAHRLRFGGPEGLIADFRWAADANARLVGNALRLAAPSLVRDPTALAGQILGRLPWPLAPALQRLVKQAAAAPGGPWLRPLCQCLERPDGPLVRRIDGLDGNITAISATPSGTRLGVLVSRPARIELLAAEDGRRLHVAPLDAQAEGWALAMADECRAWVALRHDRGAETHGSLQLWDLEEARCLASHPTALIQCDALFASAHAVLASSIHQLQRIEATGAAGEAVAVREARGSDADPALTRVLRRTDEWAGGAGIAARLVDGRSLTETGAVPDPQGRLTHNEAVRLAPGGERAYFGQFGGAIADVVLASGEIGRVLVRDGPEVTALATDAEDRRLLAGDEAGDVVLWDLERAEVSRVFSGHGARVRRVEWLAAARVASLCSDGTARLWRLDGPAPAARRSPVERIACAADGSGAWGFHTRSACGWYAAGPDGLTEPVGFDFSDERWQVRAFDALAGHAVLRQHRGEVPMASGFAVMALADGRIGPLQPANLGSEAVALAPAATAMAWTTSAGTLRLAHLQDLTPTRILDIGPLPSGYPWPTGFSGDGRWLLATVDRRWAVRIDVAEGRVATVLDVQAHGLMFEAAGVVSPDGRRALCAAHASGPAVADLDLDGARVIDVMRLVDARMAPGASQLAWAAAADSCALIQDRRLTVWRQRGARGLVWEADAPLICCALSSDGRHVAAGDRNGQVHLLAWSEPVVDR
jgi:hypothetical protein